MIVKYNALVGGVQLPGCSPKLTNEFMCRFPLKSMKRKTEIAGYTLASVIVLVGTMNGGITLSVARRSSAVIGIRRTVVIMSYTRSADYQN
jgi:hypothetical protein